MRPLYSVSSPSPVIFLFPDLRPFMRCPLVPSLKSCGCPSPRPPPPGPAAPPAPPARGAGTAPAPTPRSHMATRVSRIVSGQCGHRGLATRGQDRGPTGTCDLCLESGFAAPAPPSSALSLLLLLPPPATSWAVHPHHPPPASNDRLCLHCPGPPSPLGAPPGLSVRPGCRGGT